MPDERRSAVYAPWPCSIPVTTPDGLVTVFLDDGDDDDTAWAPVPDSPLSEEDLGTGRRLALSIRTEAPAMLSAFREPPRQEPPSLPESAADPGDVDDASAEDDAAFGHEGPPCSS